MGLPTKIISGFTHLLNTLQGGKFQADLSDELHNLLIEMGTYAAGPGNHRAKGKLTIVLDFEMELDAMRVRTNIVAKAPQLPSRPTMLFITPGNRLSLEHPMQDGLPFGVVDANTNAQQKAVSATQVIHSGQEHIDAFTGQVISN